MLASAGAAGFVSTHLKPASAPLHPPVLGVQASTSTGKLTITPRVKSADVTAVTSTYAS
jgi:hypothetical protein